MSGPRTSPVVIAVMQLFNRQTGRMLAALVAALSVFAADLLAERGVAIAVAYVAAVSLAHASGSIRFIWITAAVCSLLTVAGIFFSPGGAELWQVVLNRGLALGAIWLIVLTSLRHVRLRSRDAERSAKLQTAVVELEQHRDTQQERSLALMSVMEDLRVAQRRYQDLYDNSPDFYASVNAETGLLEQCNLTLANALGLTREELIGTSIFDLYHPDCLDQAKDAFREFRKSGLVHNAELQLRRKDGTRIDVILNVSAVRDQAGNIIRSRSVWRDVTERKRLEQRFRVMIESAPTAMVMINPQGRIVLANAETEKLFRWRRSELLGKPVELLVPDRFRGQHPRHRDAFFANPQARRMGAGRDLFGLRRDDSEFPVEIGLNPIETDEGVFVLSAIVDITERKQIEQQVRKYAAELKRSNEELEQFAYSASHDLRAPLRAIDQLAQWTLEDNAEEIPAEVRDDLKLMRLRVQRMDRLLQDLLLYSRAGRKEGTVEAIDCVAMVREVVDLLGPPDGFSVEVGELPIINTYRAPLEQVFRNLINNAIKHHDRETGRIKVSARENAAYFEFEVQDDGPGIPAKYHNQVFGMFQTLKSRDNVEGSGMGLALVKKIVEVHGGTITLESNEGKGATFRFHWPKAISLGNAGQNN